LTVVAPNVALQTTSASVPLLVTWSASDPSGIASYELQVSKNGAAFTAVTLNHPTDTSITTFRVPANTYRFQVRATDGKGNTSGFAAGPTFTPTLRQETGSGITYVGSWTQATLTGASGGSVKFAKSSTATATFSFTGRSVAWVAQMGSSRGVADVYVDGVFAQTVDLFSSTTKPRMTVFTRSFATSAAHTIQIRVKATVGRPRVDIDAFVFLK
jgi:hypothetical protein